jgi:hypothetical protein
MEAFEKQRQQPEIYTGCGRADKQKEGEVPQLFFGV